MVKPGRSEFSSSIKKISTKTDPRGEPIATPSVYTCVLDSKVKWIFFVHNIIVLK